MRHRTAFLIRALFLLAILPSWACTTGAGGGTGQASAACVELVGTICKKVAECEPNEVRAAYGDIEACTARISLACSNLESLPGSSWNSTRFAECKRAYEQASCFAGDEQLAACENTPGSLPNGAPCFNGSQCSGGRCEKPLIPEGDSGVSRSATCGTCAVQPTTPGCGDAGTCAPSERCWFGTGGSRCVAPQGEGGPCGPDVGPCAGGLTCLNAVCTKPSGVGATCTGSSDCDRTQGLACINQVCASPTFVGPGAVCDGAGLRCSAGARCSQGGVDGGGRTCIPPAADGTACDSLNGPRCLEPAECRNGVCTIESGLQCK